MTIRTSRDWRGIKHRLDNCSTEELANMRARAQASARQVDRFIQSIDTEMALREAIRSAA